MIFGIGTDVCDIRRIEATFERQGERFVRKVLGEQAPAAQERWRGQIAGAVDMMEEQLPDLTVEGFDGAIWLWNAPNERAAEWVSRRLAGNQRVLVAAPGYLQQHGTPRTLQDLAGHSCLVVRENGGGPGRRFARPPVPGRAGDRQRPGRRRDGNRHAGGYRNACRSA